MSRQQIQLRASWRELAVARRPTTTQRVEPVLEPSLLRMSVAVEEAEETWHWLVVIERTGLAAGSELDWLLNESCELRAIFAKSVSTARANATNAGNGLNAREGRNRVKSTKRG